MIIFVKQKTSYEMRISDWSSDVCSSDLLQVRGSNGNAVCQSDSCAAVKAAWLTPDGSEVVFMRREGFASAQTAIYRWRIGSFEPQKIISTDDAILGCDMQVRRVCASETSLQPRDLVETDWTAGFIGPLIDLNPEWSDLKLGTVKRSEEHTAELQSLMSISYA